MGAAPVPLGPAARHQPGVREGLEVVGEEVGWHPQRGAELARCGVAAREHVSDPEPADGSTSCVQRDPPNLRRDSLTVVGLKQTNHHRGVKGWRAWNPPNRPARRPLGAQRECAARRVFPVSIVGRLRSESTAARPGLQQWHRGTSPREPQSLGDQADHGTTHRGVWTSPSMMDPGTTARRGCPQPPGHLRDHRRRVRVAEGSRSTRNDKLAPTIHGAVTPGSIITIRREPQDGPADWTPTDGDVVDRCSRALRLGAGCGT